MIRASAAIVYSPKSACLGGVVSDDSDLLMWRDGGGNLRLLVLRQPVPPRQLFPLRLHLIPELGVRLMERTRGGRQ